MSADRTCAQSALPAVDVDRPVEAVRVVAPVAGGRPPRGMEDAASDTVEALLLSVARGNQEAFVVLQRRMAGLVRVNVRRILRDASRCEAATQETFAAVLEDAVSFDPDRGSAQTWLLMRAHQHAMDGLRCVEGADERQSAQIERSAPVLLS